MKALVGLFVVAVLTACAGPAGTTTRAETVRPSEVASSSSAGQDCLDAPVASAIVDGARTGELVVKRSAAVKSPDFKEVYFVAVEFSGYPSESRGVWATNSLEPGGGLIMSVDGPAVEVTNWPAAIDSQARITMNDPSVEVALSCL